MLDCKQVLIKNDNAELLNISFELKNSTAIVGQSGSGKSLTLKAILGLLPKNLVSEIDIKSDFELSLGKNVAFVPQNPFTALSPLTKISKQFFSDENVMKKSVKMVGLNAEITDRFPSEISGGQLQRIIIAMGISQNPKLILLDEPTTALDIDTKETIISLLEELSEKIGFSMLLVTHELSLANRLCDDCIVLKEGKIVEQGRSVDVFKSPTEIYTQTLISGGFFNRNFRQ